MDLNYCNKSCPIGIEKSRELLDKNNSAYDAAISFRFFVEDCFKYCPYKKEHKE